jgi:hypothetical protein
MPTKTWAVGEEVLAADFNSYVQTQVVATFPNAAARTAAIPTPTAGRVTYVADLKVLQVHDGTGWRTLPGGVLGHAELATNSGGVTTVPAPSTLVVNATAPGGHYVRASANVTMQQTAAASGAIHAAIYLDGTIIVQAVAVQPVGFITLTPMRVTVPAAGSHEWRVYVWTDAGTALIAGSVSVATLLVEDIGA